MDNRFAQIGEWASTGMGATILWWRIRMTQPAAAIKRQVCQLVDEQIQTLLQETSLTSSDLLRYHARSEKITALYAELDGIVRESFWELRRAS
jgi:hypothetical protein